MLEKLLGPLVNRIRKGGSERMECLERDPLFQTEGLSKSIHAADLKRKCKAEHSSNKSMKSLDVDEFE